MLSPDCYIIQAHMTCASPAAHPPRPVWLPSPDAYFIKLDGLLGCGNTTSIGWDSVGLERREGRLLV